MNNRPLQPHQYLCAEERAAIAEIEATTSILRLVTRVTQMRFAAIAKFTDTEWITCSVYDPTNLGIELGESALVETTICNEFKLNPQALLVPEISKHERFAIRPIVKRFELESYAGVPIFLPDGRMYGALCALDSTAVPLEDPDVGETLGLFARLVGCIFFSNLVEPGATPSG
ncbi:GAF domain-containing protein [Pseudomonas asplenii]|uniref:GAF domain-containing protein n=1 Tax=Pseudomonas asplenii TaxID=53407 RepID=A0A0N0E516_9PSED|nr:GAF domain-containing protein [Pseudomonas fuscovaginae]KPA91911.1 GAF domain-containing protein [Pseudomonas fuscovaginae]